MKKTIALLLTVVMCLSLCACGKSEAVKNAESLIAAIGEVTLDSESAIVAAEEAYAALNAEEKEQIENYVLLTDARATFDSIKAEELRRQEYYGEWTMIPSGNILILDLNGILRLKGQDQNWYDQEWTLTDNGVSFTYWVDLTKVDCGDYIKLVGESEIGGEKIELFRTEDLTAKDIEITIDNWQNYFFIEETLERAYDEFGEETGYELRYVFRIKPEYADYLVDSNSNTDIVIEFYLDQCGIYMNIDPETMEYSLGEIEEWMGLTPLTHTNKLSLHDLFIVNNGEKYGFNVDDQYSMAVSQLWCATVQTNHPYASNKDAFFAHIYPANLEIIRIKGTLRLYDLPIHQ